MTEQRERWLGVSLSENYTLEEHLGGGNGAELYRAVDPDGRQAAVHVLPEASVDANSTLDRFNRVRQLRHPNLVEMLDYGRSVVDDEAVLYAVYEFPDDTLRNAIEQAPLDGREAREVLDSLLDAIRYLHAQGLAHGAIDAAHVVGVGDRIKLTADSLHEAEETAEYREDIRQLGQLWQEALMAAAPNSAEVAAHAADPDANSRWTLAEIGAALRPLPVVEVRAPEPPPQSPPQPEATPAPPQVAIPEDSQIREEPPIFLPPPRPRRFETTEFDRPRMTYRFPRWIIAATAGLLVVILAMHWLRPSSTKARTPVTTTSNRSAEPVPLPPLPAPTQVIVERKPSPIGAPGNWRVIAYTYRSKEAATKKVEQINHKYTGLNAAVFSPEAGYYLVALGGRMSRDAALKLQRNARSKGLPRDVYVQNYSE